MSKFESIFTDRDDEHGQNSSQLRSSTRQSGRRSDPEYTQISAYVRKDTLRDVKVELLRNGDDRNLSELVEDLLRGWLDK